MEALLKKYMWLIKLVAVSAVVVFAASAGTNLLGSRLLLKPADEPALVDNKKPADDERDSRRRQADLMGQLASGGTTGGSAGRKQSVADAVLAGNIFCPTCAPVEPVAPTAAGGAPGSPAAGPLSAGESLSRLPLMLLATMESDDPEFSMATILHTDTNVLAPYAVNETIRAGVVLQRVERGRVVFRNGAQLEYIQLGAEPPAGAAAPVVKKETSSDKPRSSREIEGAADAISCDADFASCTVDKAFVEKLLSNPAQLTKQARIVPAVRDGETKGYKFYGIRPGSLPKLLGMKNGDLLTSVNGHQLESLDQAMDLYNKLRRASHLSISIERKGKAIQKEIDIK